MLRFLCALFLPLTLGGATPPADLVPRARALLEGWQAASPKSEARFLHLVYWTPRDHEAYPDHHARLTRIMHHIRDFYAAEMTRHGFGPRTIKLALDPAGGLVIHQVTGHGRFADYQKKDGGVIRKECLPVLKAAGIDPEHETILIFTNLTEWDPVNLTFRHNSPYYASGSHRRGMAWQLDSPELDSTNLVAKKPLIEDGQYGRISLGKHNSIFLGGIAHELGHALGLPHNMATEAEREAHGTALMGAGNRTYGDELRGEGKGSFLTLASALRLASHPLFSGSTKGMNGPTHSALPELALTAEGNGIRIRGRVQCDPPAYALVAYADPEGGGDYNATTAAAVPDPKGNFSLHCETDTPEKNGKLRLFVLHANGAVSGHMAHTPFSYPYFVEKNGRPNLESHRAIALLQPLVNALRDRNAPAARQAAAALQARPVVDGFDLPQRIAGRLLESLTPPQVEAAQLGDSVSSVAVSSLKPIRATVGWSQVTYNSVPDTAVLLRCGLRLYEHGLYAHAPAEHAYALGGRWHRLRGKAGLADHHGGTVRFRLEGDGQTLWQSKILREGTAVAFEVDLTGVQTLTFRTDPAGDGKGGDWGVWLEPTLTRAKP